MLQNSCIILTTDKENLFIQELVPLSVIFVLKAQKHVLDPSVVWKIIVLEILKYPKLLTWF